MGSGNQINVKFVADLFDCFLVEGDSHSSACVELVVFSLSSFWVRPHQVAEKTLVRDVFWLFSLLNHVDRMYFLADTSMHAKDLFVDQRANWQVLKSLAKLLPNFEAVFVECSFTRVFKTVNLVDKPAFMVTSKHVNEARVSDFICKQQSYHFNVVWIPVYVISLEQVLFVWRWSNLIEESKQILKLAVRISRNYHWSLHFYNYWFLLKDWDQ